MFHSTDRPFAHSRYLEIDGVGERHTIVPAPPIGKACIVASDGNPLSINSVPLSLVFRNEDGALDLTMNLYLNGNQIAQVTSGPSVEADFDLNSMMIVLRQGEFLEVEIDASSQHNQADVRCQFAGVSDSIVRSQRVLLTAAFQDIIPDPGPGLKAVPLCWAGIAAGGEPGIIALNYLVGGAATAAVPVQVRDGALTFTLPEEGDPGANSASRMENFVTLTEGQRLQASCAAANVTAMTNYILVGDPKTKSASGSAGAGAAGLGPPP
jgi:hypothetical protein